MDKSSIQALENLLSERWTKLKNERRTDRKNLSELWNLYLKGMDIAFVRVKANTKIGGQLFVLNELIKIINFRNDEVAGRLIVPNPDRSGQYLLIPLDVAEKILVLGMP